MLCSSRLLAWYEFERFQFLHVLTGCILFSLEGTSTAERQEEECEEKISRGELFFSEHYFKSWSNIWTWQSCSQTGSSWQSEYTKISIWKATIEAPLKCCPPWQWQSRIYDNEASKTATKTGYVSSFFHIDYIWLLSFGMEEKHLFAKYVVCHVLIASIFLGRMTIQMTCSYLLIYVLPFQSSSLIIILIY